MTIVETYYEDTNTQTQTQITLVGIVHNSRTSLNRVKTILHNTDNTVPVLLEYCQRLYETNQQKKHFKSIWHFLSKSDLTIESYVIDYCKHHNRPLEFIDMDIKVFLKHYYKTRPLTFVKDLIVRLFTTPTIQLSPKEEQILENAKIYEFDPDLYDIMIRQRDEHMFQQIRQYIVKHKPKHIIVIVGKAHLYGLLNRLHKHMGI